MEQTRRINPMAKEYRVDCVLTERENDVLYALRCNLSAYGFSGEVYRALCKLAVWTDTGSALAVAIDDALDGEPIILPNPSLAIPLNDEYTATVNPDGSLRVGCQTIQFEALERVYAEAKKAKGGVSNV
jgi:hypothetical protein